MIDKTYQPAQVEGRIYETWEQAGAFRAGRRERARAEPYSIVIPPPNVTGSLHMGHALNNTLQDILARFERMRGRDVLWQPGTDHAGIATQMVVERQLMERQQPGRRAMGREAFLKRVWEWKAESGGAIVNQLKRLGASCDWSRERFTMDEGLSCAVLKVFVELYREGLIYKDKRLVNWDPKLLTAISDLEVIQVETKGHLWHIRYPIEGKTFDPDDPSTFIVVATTRPETMLGDTAVAVHPEDERYTDYVAAFKAGKPVNVILPLVGRTIPIIADDYSDPEKGSGAVKITPAHDFNDFEVGKRHNLRQISIFTAEAKLKSKDFDDFTFGHRAPETEDSIAILADDEGVIGPPTFELIPKDLRGLDRFAARKRIVEQLQEQGFVEKIESHTHVVPHGDRSNVVIEPYLTDQWYVNAKKLAEPAIAAVRERKTKFIPQNWENTYFNWMENIQPWCISRQLWWGHQIPAWYGPKGDYFVAETEAEAKAQAKKSYGKDVPLVRDEDVLDTWFSSALWPFSTLGWPEETPELKRYYPTSALVTGFDIIFFWVARMMMMGLHFMKDIPFHDVYIHRLVRDASGAKMSKSKGNVVDPLGVIDQYGADALRFTLARGAAQGHDIRLGPQDVENNRNFATKLWNAARFAEMNECATVEGFEPKSAKQTLNRWIAHETAKAIAEVSEAIETYRFNDAAAAIYRFVWNIYCDWYLELAKPLLTGDDAGAKRETQAMVAWARDQILRLLHPFMPFITEELWSVTEPKEATITRKHLAAAIASKHRMTKRRADSIVNDAISLIAQHLKNGDRIRVTGFGSFSVSERNARKGCNPITGKPIQIKAHKKVNFRPAKALKEAIFNSSSGRSLLALARWPSFEFANEKAEAEIGWLVELVSAVRSVRAEMNVPANTLVYLHFVNPSAATLRYMELWDYALNPLARVGGTVTAQKVPPGSVQLVVRGDIVALPLKGVIDLSAERARLDKEMQKAEADIARVDAKLGNAKFIERAPEEVVEEEKEKRAEALARKAKIAEALERLKGAA